MARAWRPAARAAATSSTTLRTPVYGRPRDPLRAEASGLRHPISGGNSKRQILIMKDSARRSLPARPLSAASRRGCAETWGGLQGPQFKSAFSARNPGPRSCGPDREETPPGRHDIYGLKRVIFLGCPSRPGAKHGLHMLEDHFIREIIDP